MNVIEANDLGKRYGSTWALRECTLAVPEGHLAALVGPNGAGKTTLLNLAVGLTDPSSGTISVLGGRRAGSLAALDGIAFVAQNAPLYKNLSAADLLHETRNLNRRFDQGYAERRLGELGIPLRQKAGKMSGGQQAQVALTLALARRPQLLVLDEPLANLDPLAREDFMATVMTAASGGRSLGRALLTRPCRTGAGRRLPRARLAREHPGGGRSRGPSRGPPHADRPGFGVRAVCAAVERRAREQHGIAGATARPLQHRQSGATGMGRRARSPSKS